MSVEPPSSDRPTGPPSGPLSGPSQPPSGPPSQPPSGPPSHPTGGGAVPEPEPGPGHPWWKSAPRVAVLATAVVAAVILAVVLSRPDGGSGSGSEVFLQAAGKTGPDPFTEQAATDSSAPPVSVSPAAESAPANAVTGVDGGAPGLYGGTRNVSSCDVEKQVKSLQASPTKNRAFASVAGVEPARTPTYLRSLTPVQLRMDTRVTNHGYRDGAATSYQSVLQTGTAVLVDDRGVPRVRCACGNPLTPPVAQQSAPRRAGDSWPSYNPSKVVVVTPAPKVINNFVIYDFHDNGWFVRHHGDTGQHDKKTKPPKHEPSPSATIPTSPSSPSASPCVSGKPNASQAPCLQPKPKTTAPSSPGSVPPSLVPPSSVPPSSAPSAPIQPSAATPPVAPSSAPVSSGPPSSGSPASLSSVAPPSV
ncbi:hypothetical protein GR925_21870 [Streptomyces sp. HUCO-GS316]|uniref:DUF6777 domain-containing protein n=1 Tax=Streptomyces sp. HUCO-GS316 TaxID=2692198 RepID=UPI0013689CAE|nr:hypothetical protein [Streptomyces sp. HUCO-GS316]